MTLVPLGGLVKKILSPTILYPPLNNLTVEPSAWVVTAEPTDALVTSTKLKDPILVIGPTLVDPKPTLLTLTYSSFIFKISSVTIDVIPDKDIIEVVIETWLLTLFAKVVVIGVNDNGDWITLSSVIKDFSFLSNISNWCLFPLPTLLKVTVDPPLVVDNPNTLELVVPASRDT